MTLKNDFPIFQNNPGLIFMDSTASSQKPKYVIDGIKNYLENDYSNIHRGSYSIAERSEKLYKQSKQKVAEVIGANSWKEIIYSFNSTYAANLLVGSLKKSHYFKKGDKVLLSIVEHHANIVPWLILQEEVGIEIEYVNVDENFSLDFEDFEKKLDKKVKAISFTHVSNVTGAIFDLERVGKIIAALPDKKPLFIVDASQSVPHMEVNVEKIGCDFLFFTGHKVMSDSGIGVLWGRQKLLSEMKPCFSGGGAINWVKKTCFKEASIPDRFEPGTPNLTGAVSLLKAFEYIENIGGYKKIEEIEHSLNSYFLEKFEELHLKGVTLIGGKDPKQRASVFSFSVEGIHSLDIADFFADNNICIRAGQHCAEPFMGELGINHSSRASLYIYNTTEDIDAFFKVLQEAIKILTHP